MPGGKPARDEQAEPVGVGEVKVRRLGELGVELPQLVRRYAQAAVLHLDGEAVGYPLEQVDRDQPVRIRGSRKRTNTRSPLGFARMKNASSHVACSAAWKTAKPINP